MYKRLFTLFSFIICAFIFSFSAYAIDVSAKGAVLIECDSNDIVYSKNANMRLPMASTTKIMTALVAIENCDDLEKIIKIPSPSTMRKLMPSSATDCLFPIGEDLTWILLYFRYQIL